MTAPTLLVTRPLPGPVLDLARARFATTVFSEDRPIGDDLLAAARGRDALLVMANDRIDAALLEALAPTLRAVATYSVGHEHIDIAAATRLGVAVFNTPDVLDDAVAETALFLILSAARRFPAAAEVLRSGTWGPWSPTAMLGMQLTHKRLGIYGMGGIGRAIAVRARAFGMRIHYFNRRRLGAGLEGDAQYHATLESLLAQSDVLCVAAPSTPQTRASLDLARLSLLPPGAIVVNIARGDLVDEEALLALVHDGRLGPPGLDVFRNEPRIDPRWRGLPGAALLPHAGGATHEARLAMGRRALDGLAACFAGDVADNCLNPGVFATRAAFSKTPPERQDLP